MDVQKNNTLIIPPKTQHVLNVITEVEKEIANIIKEDGNIQALTEEQISKVELDLVGRLDGKHATRVHDFFTSLRGRIRLLNEYNPNELFAKVF